MKAMPLLPAWTHRRDSPSCNVSIYLTERSRFIQLDQKTPSSCIQSVPSDILQPIELAMMKTFLKTSRIAYYYMLNHSAVQYSAVQGDSFSHF